MLMNGLICCQVSERIDENIERLHQSLALWEDVRKINEDIDSWTSSCVIELNESLNNLNDSQKVSGRLSALQVRFLMSPPPRFPHRA